MNRKCSEETKRKISLSNKGKPKSKEHRKNLSMSRIGKRQSIYTIKKRSNSLKKFWESSEGAKLKNIRKIFFTNNTFCTGLIPWNKGISPSEEIKKKISNSKKGSIPWNKGKKNIYTKETLEKIKNARMLQIFPKKDSSIEVKIQNFLKQINIEFFTHQYMYIEHGYQCDIFIPVQEGIVQKTIIECDGDYWHGNPKRENLIFNKKILKSIELDKMRTEELTSKGYNIIRLWESEIKIMNVDIFKKKLGIPSL